jgi:hypothetical protein
MKVNTTTRAILALCALLLLAAPMTRADDNPREAASGSAPSVAAPSFGKIEAVIKDARTGAVIQDAYVSVEGCLNAAMSNESGKIFIKEVPAGTCSVTAVRKGYKPVEVQVQVNKDKTTTFSVEMKKAPKPVEEG